MATVARLIAEDSWKTTDNVFCLRESKALKWRTYRYIPLSDKPRERGRSESVKERVKTRKQSYLLKSVTDLSPVMLSVFVEMGKDLTPIPSEDKER
ncbi:hypothetical protein C0J45_0572 [Silurus meridionalis]|nr:hypothetical protein C0J45_0572 [Silurus meridionalis]